MNSKRKFFIIIGVSFVCLFAFLYFVIIRDTGFRLVESIPRLDSNVATGTGTIKLVFSENIDASINYMDRLVGADNQAVSRIFVENESLLLVMRPLLENKFYAFEITDVVSVDGHVFDRVSLSFRTKYIPFHSLPKEQKAFELSQTDRGNNEDPLLTHLPFEGDGFYITGEYTADEAGETVFVLNAQIFLTLDDLLSREEAINNYKQAINEFIKSNDRDPNSYQFSYVIMEPPARTD